MAGDLETESSEETEGGPVKSFLEHLEDFRWVLIKSLVALGLGMLICLIGANHVVAILKWPLSHNPIRHLGQMVKWPWESATTNRESGQVAMISFGTNHLGTFQLSPEQQTILDLGSNQYVSVEIEPMTIGTNHVLAWQITTNSYNLPDTQRLNVELINLSPAGAFYVAFQVAFYGGMVLASPFILYFVAS